MKNEVPLPPPLPIVETPKKLNIIKVEEKTNAIKISPEEFELNGSSVFDKTNTANIDKCDWRTITDYKYSGGSDGVFVVTLSTGNVILKGSSSPACELFASRFARYMNVPVPEMRVIEYSKVEWKECKNNLMSFAKKRNEMDFRNMEKKFNRSVILVMEYVSGIDLLNLNPLRAAEMFEEKQGKENLKGIGKMIVLDMLMNNWDRLPIIWDNEGNFGNVMFQDTGNVVGIDNGVCCIKEMISGNRNVNYDNYFVNVHNFLVALCDSPTEELPHLKNSREMLKKCGGADLTEGGSRWMQYGILLTGKQLAHVKKEQIVEIKNHICRSVRQDWENCWKNDCDKIDEDFLFLVVQEFQKMEEKIDQAIEQFKQKYDN